jgi:flagellin
MITECRFSQKDAGRLSACSDFGAVQYRLEASIRNQANVSENVSAARCRIPDADFATESAVMIQQNILQYAA